MRRIAVLLAAVTIALAPTAALAQSGGAGDDQYVDPFGSNGQQQSGGSSGSGGSSTQPSLPSTPSATASSGQATAAAPATSSRQLPRTGADAVVVAAIGAVLLLAGVALRRRLADARH
jgi:LPXTG-motif cell wall-anchored protein